MRLSLLLSKKDACKPKPACKNSFLAHATSHAHAKTTLLTLVESRTGQERSPQPQTEAESENGAEQLSSAGVPLKADREERWQAFVSMRSQYDFALIALENFLHAPEAPWSSDRTLGLTVRDLVR